MVRDRRRKEAEDGSRAKLVIKWSKLIKYWIKIIIISSKCLYETIGLNTKLPSSQPQSLQLCTAVWMQTHATVIRKTIRENNNVVETNQNKQLLRKNKKKGKKQTDRHLIKFYYTFPSFHSYFFLLVCQFTLQQGSNRGQKMDEEQQRRNIVKLYWWNGAIRYALTDNIGKPFRWIYNEREEGVNKTKSYAE